MKEKIFIGILCFITFLTSSYIGYDIATKKIIDFKQEGANFAQESLSKMIVDLYNKCEPLKFTMAVSENETKEIEFIPSCKK